ncbi:unnamed protein product [Symbiodinium sp. CCMP2592]|nr:unnamed protein product [Symbiodinium sp. CCMP2592]
MPQSAYLPARSAQDALDRALTHCHHARAILRAQQNNPHLRKQGHQTAPCRGAITLSVDLQKAFDLLPRALLDQALQAAEISAELRWAILQIHRHAQMQFKVGQHQTTVTTENGIRQGCGLSPTLWSLFTGLVLSELLSQLGKEDVTAYADDWLFQWFINQVSDLDSAIDKISFVLTTLARFGMKISVDKTVILVSVKGTKAAGALKRHVRHVPGKGHFLCIPVGAEHVLLPIVKQHTYLGLQLSYTAPEQLSLKHRFRQSWTTFNRLLPALKSSSLTQQQKLRVWHSCAYAALMYGLDCTGLPLGGAEKLLQHVAKQLRVILKSPVHLSRESSIDLLARLGYITPSQDLATRIRSRVEKCQQGHMQSLQPTRVHSRWNLLLAHADSLKQEPTSVDISQPSYKVATAVLPAMAPADLPDREHASEPETAELLQAQAQADMFKTMLNNSAASGAGPQSLGTAAMQAPAPSTPMDTAQRDGKRGTVEDESSKGNGSGKGPNKWPRREHEKGSHGRSGNGWGNHGNWGDHWGPQSREPSEVRDLCLMMSRLVLRHEDAQSIARTETGFVMFCQTQGLLSSLPDLMKANDVWKKAKEEMPNTLTMPLRVALLLQFLEIWHSRMGMIDKSEDSIANAKEMLILNADNKVPYLQYNAQEKKMEIKPDREPMELEEVMECLKDLKGLIILPMTVIRFHATRRLSQDLKGEILPMVLEIGLRTREADQAWQMFTRLCHSGACRAMAMSLRADKMGRSALATNLQKMTESMSDP